MQGQRFGRKRQAPPRVEARALTLFSGVSDAGLAKLAERTARVVLPAGKSIMTRDEAAGDIFVCLAGLVRVVIYAPSGQAIGFSRLQPGDLFGEIVSAEPDQPAACIEALRDSELLRVPMDLVHAMIDDEPHFRRHLIEHMLGVLRQLTARIVEYSTLSVGQRIHLFLLRCATPIDGVLTLNPSPTHLEIATSVSTHREAVSRELSRLSRAGVIARPARRIFTIIQPDVLRATLAAPR